VLPDQVERGQKLHILCLFTSIAVRDCCQVDGKPTDKQQSEAFRLSTSVLPAYVPREVIPLKPTIQRAAPEYRDIPIKPVEHWDGRLEEFMEK
jgi:hypothetical protein